MSVVAEKEVKDEEYTKVEYTTPGKGNFRFLELV